MFLFIESKGLLNAAVALRGHFAALSSLDISQTIICLSFRTIILHNSVVQRLLKLKGTCPRHSDLEDHNQPLREAQTPHALRKPNHPPDLQPSPAQQRSRGRMLISGSVGRKRRLLGGPQAAPGRWHPEGTALPPRVPAGGGAASRRARGSRESAGDCRLAAGPACSLHSLAMEPGGRRQQQQQQRRLQGPRREAAEYYRDHRVPQRMEEALNALFLQRPADLYGELVARGGEAVRRRPPPAPASPGGDPAARRAAPGLRGRRPPAGWAGLEGAVLGKQGPSRPCFRDKERRGGGGRHRPRGAPRGTRGCPPYRAFP